MMQHLFPSETQLLHLGICAMPRTIESDMVCKLLVERGSFTCKVFIGPLNKTGL